LTRSQNLRPYLPSLALALLLLGSATAFAAMDGSTDYTGFSLDELMGMDLVYGASRYEQRVSDAPAAVTVITGDEVRTYGWRTLGDVLATVRGVYVTYDRSYEYIGVRGFSRPGDYNTRVLVLIDGHVANDLIYSQAAAGNELPVDLDLVERIEVIRGPGSALYGTSAFFAVVNIATRDGARLDGGEVAGEAGAFGRWGGRATWGRALGDDGDLLLSASGFTADGDDLYWSEYDDPSTNDGVFVDGDGESALHLNGNVRRGGLRASAGYTERTKQVPTGEWEMLFNDNAAELFDSRVFVDAVYTGELGAATGFTAHLAYDRSLYTGDYPYDYAETGDPLLRVGSHDLADGRWLAGDVRVEGGWRGRPRLLAGGDVRKALMARQRSWDPYETFLDIDERVDNAGLFAQDEIDLGRRASLYAGLRWDTYSSFGGRLTPRLGLVAHPARGSRVKLLYGEAFRAPNAYELYYTDGATQKGNADLEPERITTWELAWEQACGPRVTGSVSLFANEIRDLVDQIVDPADDLITFVNLGEARTRGVEVELDARLLTGLRGRAGYSYQRTENAETDEVLTNSPQHIVQANLATPVYADLAAGGLTLRHLSSRRTLSGGEVPAYTVVDLVVQFTPGLGGLAIDGAVRNLFDEAYADPGAEHQAQDSLAREGRTFGIKATYRW